MQPSGHGSDDSGEFLCSQGHEGLVGPTSCRWSFPCDASRVSRCLCLARQCGQVEAGATSGETVWGLQDTSPQRQADNGSEWCAVAEPLATRNAANATQATRRTALLDILKSCSPRNLFNHGVPSDSHASPRLYNHRPPSTTALALSRTIQKVERVSGLPGSHKQGRSGTTSIDSGGTDRVVLIDPAAAVNVQISGVTVRNGNTPGSSGILAVLAALAHR